MFIFCRITFHILRLFFLFISKLFGQRFGRRITGYRYCHLEQGQQQHNRSNEFAPGDPVTPESIYCSAFGMCLIVDHFKPLSFRPPPEHIPGINCTAFAALTVNSFGDYFLRNAVVSIMDNRRRFFTIEIIRLAREQDITPETYKIQYRNRPEQAAKIGFEFIQDNKNAGEPAFLFLPCIYNAGSCLVLMAILFQPLMATTAMMACATYCSSNCATASA